MNILGRGYVAHGVMLTALWKMGLVIVSKDGLKDGFCLKGAFDGMSASNHMEMK